MSAAETKGKRHSLSAPRQGDSVEQLIVEALQSVRDELAGLTMLPERRYDRAVFPTIGQYDWALGQVLYALVRFTKPRRVLEFSTSSGYSTSFTALALAKNGVGLLETVDIDAKAQGAAEKWLGQLGVLSQVRMHTGDCRVVVPPLLGPDVDILFVDTLHSFEITAWYLRELVPKLNTNTLVHIHDVMPPEARVRIHGGPPYASVAPPAKPNRIYLLKRALWLLRHGKFPNPFPGDSLREVLPLDRLETFGADGDELPTIDGNYFEEATLIRELLLDSDPKEAVYVHRLVDALPVNKAQQFAGHPYNHRTNGRGEPFEWNDGLWCRAATLQRCAAPGRVRDLVSKLRTRYYGS